MNLGADDLLAVLGYRPGMRAIDVVFTNPDVDTATVPETCWPLGGVLPLRTSAAAVEIVSSSASDAAAGTGARTVLVWGLDANYNELTETLTLNGVTPVVGSALFFRINSVIVQTAGSTLSNVGIISIRDAGAGTTRSAIAAASGRSETGVFTVPAGHSMLATGWTVSARDSVGNKALADIAFYTTVNGVRSVDWRMSIDGTVPANLGSPHVFHEKADIEVMITRTNTNDTVVSFHGHGILVGPNNGL